MAWADLSHGELVTEMELLPLRDKDGRVEAFKLVTAMSYIRIPREAAINMAHYITQTTAS